MKFDCLIHLNWMNHMKWTWTAKKKLDLLVNSVMQLFHILLIYTS